MKNSVLFRSGFLVAALALTLSLYAQEQTSTSGSGISAKFGIKGGVNLANLYDSEVGDENLKVGLNVGLLAKLPLVKGLSLQPELLYSQKGTKATYDNIFQGEGEYRFNLHYVELPILLSVNLTPNLNLHAGPYVAYLAGVNITQLEDGQTNELADLDADNFNRFDFGVAGGLGLDISNFTIGARYTLGLKEIGKDDNIPGAITQGSKNSAISLYIGFGF